MLKVTLEAARQIRQAAMQSGADDMALRVAATRDPKGDIEYGMGFDVALSLPSAYSVRPAEPASPESLR